MLYHYFTSLRHWALRVRVTLRQRWLAQQPAQSSLDAALWLLEPALFEHHHPFGACQVPLRAVYADLKQYTVALRKAQRYLERSEAITAHWCRYEYVDITMESLFIERHSVDRHLAPVAEVRDFKAQAQQFSALYALRATSPHVDDVYHARILGKFQSHVTHLTQALLAYSAR